MEQLEKYKPCDNCAKTTYEKYLRRKIVFNWNWNGGESVHSISITDALLNMFRKNWDDDAGTHSHQFEFCHTCFDALTKLYNNFNEFTQLCHEEYKIAKYFQPKKMQFPSAKNKSQTHSNHSDVQSDLYNYNSVTKTTTNDMMSYVSQSQGQAVNDKRGNMPPKNHRSVFSSPSKISANSKFSGSTSKRLNKEGIANVNNNISLENRQHWEQHSRQKNWEVSSSTISGREIQSCSRSKEKLRPSPLAHSSESRVVDVESVSEDDEPLAKRMFKMQAKVTSQKSKSAIEFWNDEFVSTNALVDSAQTATKKASKGQTESTEKEEKDTQHSEILHQCDLCDRSYKQRGRLESHRKSHIYAFQCAVCKKKFSNPSFFYKHMENKHTNKRGPGRPRGGTRPKPCGVCDRHFPSLSILRRHQSLIHHARTDITDSISDDINKEQNESGEILALNVSMLASFKQKPSICIIQKVGQRVQDIGKPPSTSSGPLEAKKKCPFCSKMMIPHNLKRHIMVHTGEKPFKCTKCCKTVRTQQELNLHLMNQHGVIKTYSCKICHKVFKSYYTLQNHAKAAHALWKFTCGECGKSYKYKITLDRHMQFHENPHQNICSICNQSFSRLQSLLMHLRAHESQNKTKPTPPATELTTTQGSTNTEEALQLSRQLENHVEQAKKNENVPQCKVKEVQAVSSSSMTPQILRDHDYSQKPNSDIIVSDLNNIAVTVVSVLGSGGSTKMKETTEKEVLKYKDIIPVLERSSTRTIPTTKAKSNSTKNVNKFREGVINKKSENLNSTKQIVRIATHQHHSQTVVKANNDTKRSEVLVRKDRNLSTEVPSTGISLTKHLNCAHKTQQSQLIEISTNEDDDDCVIVPHDVIIQSKNNNDARTERRDAKGKRQEEIVKASTSTESQDKKSKEEGRESMKRKKTHYRHHNSHERKKNCIIVEGLEAELIKLELN